MMEDMVTVNAAEGGDATLRLDRTMPIEALVVDAADQPIASAEIRIASGAEEEQGKAFEKILRTDAAGKAAFGRFLVQTEPGDSRPPQNAAAPMKTSPWQGSTVRSASVLSAKSAFALHGTLVDDAGTPIAPQI